MKKINLILLLILFLAPVSLKSESGASLYFSPSNGSSFIGETFDVSIFVNTGGKNINAIKVDLKFDPKKLQVASPSTGKSFISVWISQPTYSNTEGKITFQGGTPSPGINTSAGLISTVTFRAVSPGETSIYILDSSSVLLDDGKGTNILSSKGKGIYQISIPPPEGPKVYSSTHPDQNKWYKNNNPSFSWEKEERITGFSYAIDNDLYNVPDNISEGDYTSVSYSDLKDGIWYFHIKSKSGDTWGGISNYLLQIDNSPPANFKIEFEPSIQGNVINSKEPIIYVITTDSLSGFDHFELKIINLNERLGKEEAGFFMEITSPYKLPVLEPGEYELVVRAYDKAMNYIDVSKRIEIVPSEKLFYAKKQGVYFLNLFIGWKLLAILLLIIIILIILVIIILRKRHKKLVSNIENLRILEEKIKKNNDKIENELYEK